MKNVIVIGAGAAGLFSAFSASQNNNVILLEKMSKPGIKLSVTGGGRCNITHKVDSWRDLLEGYASGDKFLNSVFSRFSDTDLIEFFENIGIKTFTDRGGRIFPVCQSAPFIVEKMIEVLKKNGVKLIYNCEVSEIKKAASGFEVVSKDARKFNCDKLIVATGGRSYPATGSTGDGYRLLKKLGHTVTKLNPSLVPLVVKESWVPELKGLTLKNVLVKVLFNGKKSNERFGDMLFTHYGLSGPVILFLSREVINLMEKGNVELSVDLKPALDRERLLKRIERDFNDTPKKQLKNSLDKLLPKSLIPVMIKLSGILPLKTVNQLSKKEKEIIVNLFKDFRFKVIKTMSYYYAEVTQGGIELSEVSSKTMESKIVPGLFIAGELQDIDGYIGGYNLQAAFSTGWIAGKEC